MPDSSPPAVSDRTFPDVRFAGLRLTPLDVPEVVKTLATRDPTAPFAPFVTPNMEHAYWRRFSPEFRACSESSLIIPNDSRILHRAARLAGIELKFAPGAYVVAELFEQAVKFDDPLSIIGGTVELVDDLKRRFGLTAVAQHIPPFGFIRDEAAIRTAVEFIVAHPARFVFVAMGPPQSEVLCQRVVEDGRATGLGLCIGSSLQVLTRTAHPAPAMMENAGLVWLYRLVREPRRLWRRYLVRGLYGVSLGLKDVIAIRLGLRRAVDV